MSDWRVEDCLLDHPHPPLPAEEGEIRACIGPPLSHQSIKNFMRDFREGAD